MKQLAAVEVAIVFVAIITYIWRWQYVFPDFAVYLLAFIIASFFIHRDQPRLLGFGSYGLLPTVRRIWRPTVAAMTGLILIGWITRSLTNMLTGLSLDSFGRYFAWCLFQQFGLQSFFSNRLAAIVEKPNRAAWLSAGIFSAFHLPNPTLIPVTFLGGYFLARVFLSERNLLPLAFAQAVVGILLSVALPASWHHGLRVGPGYYR
jgi:CAAX prenyl protease-like protein